MRTISRPAVWLGLAALAITTIGLIPAMSTTAHGAVTEVVSEDFEDGTIGALWPSGYAGFGSEDFIADPEDATNTVLSMTGRTENWYSVSTAGTGEVLTQGVAHTASVRVRLVNDADAGATVSIADDQTYGPISGSGASAVLEAGTWATLTGEYTPGAADTKLFIAANAGIDLLVDDVLVTAGSEDEPVEEACPADDQVIANHDFEDGVDGWQGRGDGAVATTTADARTGTQALEVTGRTQNWHGAQLPVTSLFTAGTYTISAWVKLPTGTDATDVKLTVQGSGDTYTEAAPAVQATDAEWVNLCGTHTVAEGVTPSVLYVEAVSTTAPLYLDDVEISTADAVVEPCEPDTSIDFEDGTTGSWIVSDAATLTVVDDAGDGVLEITDRTASHFGIQSPEGAFEPGVAYTFSAEVLLEADADVRFIAYDESTDNVYNWVGSTAVTAGEWTTISGAFTFGADSITTAKVYIEVSTNDDYRVDDIVVTAPCGDNGGIDVPDGFVPGGAAAPTATPVSAAQVPDSGDGYYAALTFDDGPNPPATNELLDFLAANDVTATFCVIGENIGSQAQIDTLRRIVADGHVLCNHTTGYSAVDGWSDQQIADDLIANLGIIRDAVGDPNLQVPFYRAPNGAWGNSGAVAAELGMQPLGLGNTIADWQTQDEATLTASLRSAISPENSGEIVLVHDGGGDRAGSVAAVKTVVAERLAEGWTFTLPEGTPAAAGTVVLSTDFENGGLDGWHLRDSGFEGPTPTVELTEEQSHSPSHSAVIRDRRSQGDGLRYDISGLLEPGVTYEVTTSFRFADDAETDDVVLSLEADGSFSNLVTFTGMSNSEWVTGTGTFSVPAAEEAYLYFETAWEAEGVAANTSTLFIDDITVAIPAPAVIEDLTPIQDTVPFPVGVAIDARETMGSGSELLLRHFDQISAENHMKPEAWYNDAGEWAPSPQIDQMMDFAVENDLRVYGHVLVWHSQTPAFFFQDDAGQPLTSSPEDQEVLRQRMKTHIDNVADYLSAWGEFGGDNPLVAWDVVNEVIDDSAAYADGMRRSEWYRILGETFVDDAFVYADQAFNVDHAAAGADRPVTLFINDYNTEQSGKRGRYLALIDRLISRGAPIDGIGHQFHVNLSLPVTALEDAIVDAQGRGLVQAVTELDVTTGVPESEAKFVDQGYYYRDAFDIFRTYADQMYSVTIWGLIDSRSWRDDNGGPLVFDDAYQAKPAYYGIVEGEGGTDPLPPRLRAANVFAGSVALDGDATASAVWERLPLLDIEGHGAFQFRWAPDQLTVYVSVQDSTADATDGLEFTVDGVEHTFGRDGSGDVTGAVTSTAEGYDAVVQLPLDGAGEGDAVSFDARVVDGGDTFGWNSPGVTGTLTLVEELSYTEVPETATVPQIDGTKEALWEGADVVTTDKQVTGSGGAVGTFHSLWKDNTLYLYAEIADDVVDVTGSDPWTQDSVEIYVDGGNFKNGSYRYDDTQIRINAENVISFGTGDEGFQANRVESATSLIDGGYAVEVAISLLEYGGEGTFHGLDVQVNDATNGARDTIRNWADPTGAGYQSTSRWGVAQLVAADAVDPGEGNGGNNGGGNPGGGPGNGNGGPPFLTEDGVLELPNGKIVVPGSARQGETITVNVGTEHAGTQTQAVLYSEPTLIGTDVVSAGGAIRVTIPLDTEVGEHTLAIYDADGALLGWASIDILAAADGSLSATGADGYLTPAVLAMLLLAAGALLAMRGRRAGVSVD